MIIIKRGDVNVKELIFANKKGVGRMRRFFLTVLIFAVVFVFCGCGGGGYPEIKIDAAKMANAIINGVDFESNMQQINKDSISAFIDLPGADPAYMFMGAGEKADSFGVFVFDSESDSKDGEKAVKEYLKDLGDSFSRYIPEETDKVENHSLVIRKGRNLVFAVTADDENAEEIIEGVFQEEADDPTKEILSDDGEDEEGDEEDSTEAQETSQSFDISAYPPIDTSDKMTYSGYIALVGNSAYELYTYVDSTAQNYADAINYTADQLEGQSTVYDLIVPLSSGVTLPDKYFGEIQSSDQYSALQELYAKMNEKVVPVNIYDNMMKHRNEYIYFRTDHHWTSLGAYYGYEKWCELKDILPISLDRREHQSYGNFVGTFYYDTEADVLKKNPDTIDAYFPMNDVYVGSADSKEEVIFDYSDAADYIKYNAFLGGDKALSVITNDSVTDGSVCIVVKESFGNCFVPYLADHYNKVYVCDYRYSDENIIEAARSLNAKDVIFVNNIGMTRSTYLVGRLNEAVKG
jgi:hypothetical protein